jgi:hypothetical protein
MVKIQEGENQIITDYAVSEKRPSDVSGGGVEGHSGGTSVGHGAEA